MSERCNELLLQNAELFNNILQRLNASNIDETKRHVQRALKDIDDYNAAKYQIKFLKYKSKYLNLKNLQ